jgi:hypothetical protein
MVQHCVYCVMDHHSVCFSGILTKWCCLFSDRGEDSGMESQKEQKVGQIQYIVSGLQTEMQFSLSPLDSLSFSVVSCSCLKHFSSIRPFQVFSMFSIHPKIKNLSFSQVKNTQMGRKNTAFLELSMEHLIKHFIMIILVCSIPLPFLDVVKKINTCIYKCTYSCA